VFGDLATADQPLGYAPGSLGARPDSQSALGQAVAALGSSLPAAVVALDKSADLPFHIWSAGALEFGALKPDGTYDNRFSTSGLTIGFDRDFGGGLKAGVAFGAGLDSTTVGTDGSKSDSWAYNGTFYASYRFMPHTFLDVIAGYGRMRFDLRRWSTDGAVMLKGVRGGADAFGSVGLTEEVKWGDVKLSPYGRMDVVRASLDAYSETGSSIWALSYRQVDATTFTGVLGARIAYPIAMSWGTLTPMARLEYSHAFDGGYTQNLGYADLTGGGYSFSGAPTVGNVYTGGLALRAESANALSLDLEYLFSGSGRQFEGQEIRASVRGAF
jgi:outer membrane autotransporter protein